MHFYAIQKALQVACDIFQVPQDYDKSVLSLRCRREHPPPKTQWMVIQPEAWNEIVDDMEFFLVGFETDLRHR